jgi:hypothetical protein
VKIWEIGEISRNLVRYNKKNFLKKNEKKKIENIQNFPGKIEYFSCKSELFRSENSVSLAVSVREVVNTLKEQCPIVVFARKF